MVRVASPPPTALVIRRWSVAAKTESSDRKVHIDRNSKCSDNLSRPFVARPRLHTRAIGAWKWKSSEMDSFVQKKRAEGGREWKGWEGWTWRDVPSYWSTVDCTKLASSRLANIFPSLFPSCSQRMTCDSNFLTHTLTLWWNRLFVDRSLIMFGYAQ